MPSSLQADPPPASPSPSPSTSTSSPSSTPTSRSASRTPQPPYSQSSTSYFSYPVTHVVSGLYRRFTDPNSKPSRKMRNASPKPSSTASSVTSSSPVFTPVRTASPFQPPPLTPLTLFSESGSLQQQLLTRALAEEIRLLVPARLQLADTWRLAYSLDRDGASLSTLYDNCHEFSHRSPRAGYVLVVRDSSPAGAMFGAYMTDPPHPASHYFGTGECFLWRASVLPRPRPIVMNQGPPSQDLLELAGLPPPPSADTTHAGRSTTLRGEKKDQNGTTHDKDTYNEGNGDLLAPPNTTHSNGSNGQGILTPSGASTPERIRFKAFPYSGVNDYMMFCETGFLSLGGG